MKEYGKEYKERIRYQKWQSILILSLFIFLIGGMFITEILLADRSFSEIENRSLASFKAPTFKTVLNGDFMENTDAYLSDQTPIRDKWVELHAHLERMSGKKDVEGVCKTDNGNLIALLPEYAPLVAENNVGYVMDFAKETGLPLYFGLIPTAADILSDELPAGAPTMDEACMIEKLYSLCADGNPKLLDFRSALLSHKDEYIYYRTDHHWTSLGACYGANVLLAAMNEKEQEKLYKLLDPTELAKSTVTESFYGTNCSTSGIFTITPDQIDTYIEDEGTQVTAWRGEDASEGSLYAEEYLSRKDKYSYFLGGNMALGEIKTKTKGPKLLLIRDSYSSSMIPFLTRYFSEIHVFDMRYNRMSVKEYAKAHDIDQVAVIYGLKTFMEDANLVFLKK